MTEFINILASLVTLASVSVALWRRLGPGKRGRVLGALAAARAALIRAPHRLLGPLLPALRRAGGCLAGRPRLRAYVFAVGGALGAAVVVVVALRYVGPAADARRAEAACLARGDETCDGKSLELTSNLHELEAAKTCKGIKSAAHHAMDIGDKRALPALRRLQSRVDRNFFKKLCVGSEVDVAVAALAR